MKRHEPFHSGWYQLIASDQRHPLLIDRQSVEGRPMQAGEPLQTVHRLLLIKHLGVALQCVGSVEDAGASAGGLLSGAWVRS